MIAVVILTYQARRFVEPCLSSLAETLPPETSVIVVDNASTDGTREWLRHSLDISKYRHITILLNEENCGFAEGNNVGIRYALEQGTEHVILLNQDTRVTKGWIEELVHVATSDSRIGAVQSRLMLWPDTEKVNSLGNAIHFLGFGYADGSGEHFEISKYRNIDISAICYPSGAAMLIKRQAFEDVGLFDPRLFLYHEDLDLGWRLRMRGWRIVLAPKSVVYHEYEFSRSIKKYYYMERNRFLVLFENYKFGTLLLIAPAFSIIELGLFLFSIPSGWFVKKLQAYAFFLKPSTWWTMIQKRHKKQRRRTVPDRDIMQHFTGIIASQEVKNPVVTYIVNPVFNLYFQVIRRIIFW